MSPGRGYYDEDDEFDYYDEDDYEYQQDFSFSTVPDDHEIVNSWCGSDDHWTGLIYDALGNAYEAPGAGWYWEDWKRRNGMG